VAAILDEARESFSARLVEGLEARSELARLAIRGWVGFVEAATLGWLAARDRIPREALRDMLIQAARSAVQAARSELAK
jgi:hypothetical protein